MAGAFVIADVFPSGISAQLVPYYRELLIASLLFGYLVGSTPFGLILSRLAELGDIMIARHINGFHVGGPEPLTNAP